uniref:MYB family transcription factor n=1 Tax=Melilotus albus TaxID=47082 RepID=A0A896WF15_MELAB|nr:MYB family transcription factor [Melilotus albus]
MDREEYLRKCSNMKCQRIQVNESYVPSLQDDEMEVEHLLEEPRNDHVSLDGSLASHTALNDKDDLELEVLDGFLNEGFLDDVDINDLEGTDGFSDACGGYFLDFDLSKVELLGSGAYEDSLLENSNSESHSPGFSGSSTAGGISESTKAPNSTQSKCKIESIDETVTHDTHGVFRSNPSQPSSVDCMYNISLDIQHLHELNNGYPLAGGLLSCKKESVTVETCQSAPPREKRFRKPTQRYIEESSNLRSKEKIPTAGAKLKRRSVSTCNELRIKIKELKNIPYDKSSDGNSDVTLSELQSCKKHPKKEELEYDYEPFSSEESEDECLESKRGRSKDRRKNQRMWTTAEVMKLIDGISEYGVGRWTDIQRILFSSEGYRTPTDVRDKWRNLLRACSAQKFNKQEDEQNDETATRSIPFSVACRVLELAKIHPYPKRRNKKRTFESQVGQRNLRRKKCT